MLFFAKVAATYLVLAATGSSASNGQNGDIYFSPATGVFTCSDERGDLLLLNDQAAQNCRIVIAGFSQNGIDSKGSVLFESGRPNATLYLACGDDADTAIRSDTLCTCEPINSLGEGCAEGTWKSGGSAPHIAHKWPPVKPGKTTYSPATGTFTCSAVAGDACTLNPQASRTCNFYVDGFSYERESDWGVRLVSAAPYATVSVPCLPDLKTAIQCDDSCVCEPINGEGCRKSAVATLKFSLGLHSFGIAVCAWLV